MSRTKTQIINKIASPTYKTELLSTPVSNNNSNTDPPSLNLWQFIKLYKVDSIPVVYFIMVYVAIYLINKYFLKYDYKHVLAASVIFTLLFAIIAIPNVHLSAIILILLLLLIYYLMT